MNWRDVLKMEPDHKQFLEDDPTGDLTFNGHKMRRFLFLVLFSILSLADAQAQSSELFEQGNSAYAEGDYEAAVRAYEKILEMDQTAAEVHYNLGNAHYRLNNIGPSIFHYEKALQLDPNDSDIRNNLQFAQNMTVDAVEEMEQNGFIRWWHSFLGSFGTTGWAILGIVCMFLFVLSFLAYYFNAVPFMKRMFFLTGLTLLFFSISSVTLGFLRYDQLRSQDFAIVFAEEVGISSEPNDRGEDLFFLHEGTKVEVLEEFQEWFKIELANGNQGWIQQQAIKKL